MAGNEYTYRRVDRCYRVHDITVSIRDEFIAPLSTKRLIAMQIDGGIELEGRVGEYLQPAVPGPAPRPRLISCHPCETSTRKREI
jgi:hypothetical protein